MTSHLTYKSTTLHDDVLLLTFTRVLRILERLLNSRWPFASRRLRKQESPAVADKPARRESMPKIVPIRRAYNVVADNTGL